MVKDNEDFFFLINYFHFSETNREINKTEKKSKQKKEIFKKKKKINKVVF